MPSKPRRSGRCRSSSTATSANRANRRCSDSPATPAQQIVAEVFARRLDSPLDSFLRLTDAEGKQLAFNDDFEDKGTGWKRPRRLVSHCHAAGGRHLFHSPHRHARPGRSGIRLSLRISEPRPDFALRIVPSSLSLRTGMSAPLTIFALRRDGFTNAINLKLKDAREGFH